MNVFVMARLGNPLIREEIALVAPLLRNDIKVIDALHNPSQPASIL